MKKKFLQLWLITHIIFIAPTIMVGQSNCEEYPARLDSVHYHTWNQDQQIWEIKTAQLYEYTSFNKLSSFQSFDAITRAPLTRREYYYDNESNLIETLSFKWVNDGWQNVQNVFYTKAPNGTDRYETIYNWVNNAWYLQSRIIRHFESERMIGYTGQLVNRTTMEFYNYANYFISYTDFDKIDEWYGQKISDGSILFKRFYFYNDQNRLNERHIFTPSGGQLLLNVRNLYFYDVYGLHRESINQRPVGEDWENTERNVNFYRIDNASRVRICNNGKSQCIPKDQVPNFLSKGATLGACPSPGISTTETHGSTIARGNLKSSEIVQFYPNPATESINVFAGVNFSRVELINSTGQTVRAFPLQNGDYTVIERNGLPSGIYFLRFVGQDEVKTEKVIFK